MLNVAVVVKYSAMYIIVFIINYRILTRCKALMSSWTIDDLIEILKIDDDDDDEFW